MAVAAETLHTTGQESILEDLHKVISIIDQHKTPIRACCDKGGSAHSNSPEWTVDDIEDATDNSELQGDSDITPETSDLPERRNNQIQTMVRQFQLSDQINYVTHVGRANNPITYQFMKKGTALNKDIERAITRNNSAVSPTKTVKGIIAGIPSWVETNELLGGGSDAADGGWDSATKLVEARTDAAVGDQVVFGIEDLRTLDRLCFETGTEPSMIFVPPALKQRFSALSKDDFTDKRTQVGMSQEISIQVSAEKYHGDFNMWMIMPDVFMRPTDVLVLDPDYIEILWLSRIHRREQAPGSLSKKYMLTCDFTLAIYNEKAHGGLFDRKAA